MEDQFLLDLMGEWGGSEHNAPAQSPAPSDTSNEDDAEKLLSEVGEASAASAQALLDSLADEPQFPTLYHKGKDGAIREWRVWTDGATIYSEHGIQGGQKQISTKIAQPKNVGRSNATTGEQQAVLEAQAMWTKRVERKYRQDLNEAQETIFLPMLAHKFFEKQKHIQFPVDVQPKLDGVRCIAYWDEAGVRLMSRQGKEYSVPKHIAKQLEAVLPKDAILDGELYKHGQNLQTINKWVKKLRPETALLEYHIYDVPQWDGVDDKPWSERKTFLICMQERIASAMEDARNLHVVETICCDSADDAFVYQRGYVADGYEGAIIRDRRGEYLWGHRSEYLLKLKTFQDGEYEVTGFCGGDPGTKEEDCVVWECVTPEGKPFTCRPMGSLESRRELMKVAGQYIGKKLTVRFFDFTEENKPRFPVGVAFRLDEDLP